MQKRLWFGRHTCQVFVLAAGCNIRGSPSKLSFESTEEPQRAVFLTDSWAGGGGDPVLTSPDANRTLMYKGKPVFVLLTAKQKIMSQIGRQPPENPDGRILVDAKVHLESATATVSTNPPSKKKIYRVVIDQLIHAEWFVP